MIEPTVINLDLKDVVEVGTCVICGCVLLTKYVNPLSITFYVLIFMTFLLSISGVKTTDPTLVFFMILTICNLVWIGRCFEFVRDWRKKRSISRAQENDKL